MSRLPKGGSHSSHAGKIFQGRGSDENEGATWQRQRRREKKTKNKTTSRVFFKKKSAANQATRRGNRWLLCCPYAGFRARKAAERRAASEHFHLGAGYPYPKTVPSLSPSRPPKAFDPVNIITGERARAGRQRGPPMRENCREKDESTRYKQQFGAKVRLPFHQPLPTITGRWRPLDLYFTWHLRHCRRNWGSTWSSHNAFPLEEPFPSSVDCGGKQVRIVHKLQKKPEVQTLGISAAAGSTDHCRSAFASFFHFLSFSWWFCETECSNRCSGAVINNVWPHQQL